MSKFLTVFLLLLLTSPVLAQSTYAELGNDDEVKQVIVIDSALEASGQTFAEKEALGLAWLESFGPAKGKKFMKTGEGARKNQAGIGYKYDKALDAFIPPKLDKSWVFDPATARWKDPKEAK